MAPEMSCIAQVRGAGKAGRAGRAEEAAKGHTSQQRANLLVRPLQRPLPCPSCPQRLHASLLANWSLQPGSRWSASRLIRGAPSF